MPHSTRGSIGSNQTFDLTKQDTPGTPESDETMKNRSRASSSGYGVAVTSSPQTEQRNAAPPRPKSQAAEVGELSRLRRRSTPGTADDFAVADMIAQRPNLEELVRANDGRSYSYNDASRRRSQHYEEQFQYKENGTSQTRERVQKQTPVIAELKTNVIIKDEFTLVTDLSYQLAQRYTRPDSCIMIKVDHSACLAMGGTFDPCYFMNITAVTSQMGSSTNKRNAALIQSFMADILSVPADRGIVTFNAIPEDNLATKGNTIAGELEMAEKQERGRSINKGTEDATRKSMTFTKKSTPRLDAETNGHAVNGISSASANAAAVLGPPTDKKKSSIESMDSTSAERPKTAHGTTPAVNGLRMHPIASDELRAADSAQLPNGRPKSVGAPSRSATMIADQIRQEPIPNVVRQTSQQAAAQTRPPAVKTRSMPMKTQNATPLAPRPVQAPANAFTTSSISTPFSTPVTVSKVSSPQPDKKEKAVYLDMVTALPVKQDSPKDASVSVSELVPRNTFNGDVSNAAANRTANTAKRRSQTMTATPKIPHLHPPPPVPAATPGGADRLETRSVNSKLSKRKSLGLLKMFKRESKLEPWYKQ